MRVVDGLKNMFSTQCRKTSKKTPMMALLLGQICMSFGCKITEKGSFSVNFFFKVSEIPQENQLLQDYF